MVLGEIDGRVLAIYAAARSIKQPAGSRLAHRFENVLRQVGPFPKIDIGLGDRLRDVRVRREMKDCVATSHGFTDLPGILQIGFYNRQPPIARCVLKITSLS